MNDHRIRKRKRNPQQPEIALDITIGNKPVTLRQIPEPVFARSLGLVDTIDYPDGELEVLCGHNIGQPAAIFGCYRCHDCGEETWFAAATNGEQPAVTTATGTA